MSRIYYFSGTGNSLRIADSLSQQLSGCIALPVVAEFPAAAKERLSGTIGFVFPVHAFSLPTIVTAFLERLEFEKDAYVFAIATRMGSSCRAFENMDAILQKKGVQLSASWFLNMPNNYLTLLPLSDAQEAAKLNAEAEEKLPDIAEIVRARQIFSERDPHYSFFEKNMMFPILSGLYNSTNYFGMENKFHTDEKCNGCGLCARVCPSFKITMSAGKPVWQRDVRCYHCLACIHYCPQKAIQINNATKKAGRYHHPEVSASRIEAQKHQ